MAKRKLLTQEEKSDAARLKKLYEQRKAANPALTQEAIADEIGWQTQSAVSQFMNGVIPLKMESAIKFAEYFDCKLEDISPRLAKILNDYYLRNKNKVSNVLPFTAKTAKKSSTTRPSGKVKLEIIKTEPAGAFLEKNSGVINGTNKKTTKKEPKKRNPPKKGPKKPD